MTSRRARGERPGAIKAQFDGKSGEEIINIISPDDALIVISSTTKKKKNSPTIIMLLPGYKKCF